MEPTTIIDTRGSDTLDSLGAIRTAVRLLAEGDSFVIWYDGAEDIAGRWWVTATKQLAQEADAELKFHRGRGRIRVDVLS